MRAILVFFLLLSTLAIGFSQNTSDDGLLEVQTNTSNTTYVAVEEVESPWSENSKICIFIKEWVLKGVFVVIFLIFLLGIATVSGAAFPQWRNIGSSMILGSIGAVVLYIIGTGALRFLMGWSVCGL